MLLPTQISVDDSQGGSFDALSVGETSLAAEILLKGILSLGPAPRLPLLESCCFFAQIFRSSMNFPAPTYRIDRTAGYHSPEARFNFLPIS